jgi:hypothetical protein
MGKPVKRPEPLLQPAKSRIWPGPPAKSPSTPMCSPGSSSDSATPPPRQAPTHPPRFSPLPTCSPHVRRLYGPIPYAAFTLKRSKAEFTSPSCLCICSTHHALHPDAIELAVVGRPSRQAPSAPPTVFFAWASVAKR